MSGKSKILCKIPRELWLNIFQYGVIEDALKVHDISSELFLACCFYTKHKMSILRYNILQSLRELQCFLKEQSFDGEEHRLNIIRSITYLWYMLTELNILYCSVKRYFPNNEKLIVLCPKLIPIIKEFDSLRKRVENQQMERTYLTFFNMKLLLKEYFSFFEKLDDGLYDEIDTTPFEIKVIDMLSCCPSINSQLSIIEKNNKYNISFFCQFYELKPAFQVPDVHNSQLSKKEKLLKLLSYLRQCVQWENTSFFQLIINDITNLEFRLNLVSVTEIDRDQIIVNLLEKYIQIQQNPYQPIFYCDFNFQVGNESYKIENFSRLVTMNQNMTGLSVTVIIPEQPPDSLPLAIHSYRQKHGLLNETVIELREDDVQFQKLKYNLKKKSVDTRAFQLCIYFREGLNSSPAEAIIDVVHENSDSEVSLNVVQGDAFFTDIFSP